jgi:CheY-like chemotaxis protein
MTKSPASATRIMVVEDEYLIRMLLEDMLTELGYDIAAAVGTIAEALDRAKRNGFDAAVLDVNLNGKEVFPVAEILDRRGVPFMFVTGYGETNLPAAFRERLTLQKPFQSEQLKSALESLLSLSNRKLPQGSS